MRGRRAFTLVELPFEKPSTLRLRPEGFTLVELLVVVAIIALLVSILLPSLGRAKDMVRKAVCASQLRGHGSILGMYVAGNGTYPVVGNDSMSVIGYAGEFSWGYPKFNAIMLASKIAPTHWTNVGLPIYALSNQVDLVWRGSFCPAMDAASIYAKCLPAGFSGDYHKVGLHVAAIGYQWNVALRGRGLSSHQDVPGSDKKRWPAQLWQPSGDWDNTQWIDMFLNLPAGSFVAQAISPEEVKQAASVAEGWCSWDFGSVPNIDINNWEYENCWPGWHIGPQSRYTNGWAILNANRHKGCPNILYADSHVASDAKKVLTQVELGGGAVWQGITAVSWDDYDPKYGTLNHIVPVPEQY